MTTVGRLARSFGLSRSTLLYYDSIGLLEPSGRSAKGYRLYTEEDAQRLEQICRYRKTGVSLQEIKHLLEAPGSRLAEILERRLDDLNGEIHDLQEQQRVIVGLLEKQGQLGRVRIMNRERWISLLAASGFSEQDMRRWHAEFERATPRKHQEFLELLCFSDTEIRGIRARAKALSRRVARGQRS
jgi:DNA-binding transcriptional MerR regulator